MHYISESVGDGLSARNFIVGEVPGVLWTPAGPARPRPLVLLGHGGGQHKASPGMVGRARRFAADGFAVAAIDAPGHGDRPRTDRERRFSAGMTERLSAGEPVASHVGDYHAAVAEQAVGDWKSVLDALQGVAGLDNRVGYWGVSLGAAIGLPFIAADSRIDAAVVGLVSREMVPVRAARVSIPLEFLGAVGRRAGAAAVRARISSTPSPPPRRRSTRIPGRMAGVPRFEVESAARFFLRHLT